jgi:hypothetical protein
MRDGPGARIAAIGCARITVIDGLWCSWLTRSALAAITDGACIAIAATGPISYCDVVYPSNGIAAIGRTGIAIVRIHRCAFARPALTTIANRASVVVIATRAVSYSDVVHPGSGIAAVGRTGIAIVDIYCRSTAAGSISLA